MRNRTRRESRAHLGAPPHGDANRTVAPRGSEREGGGRNAEAIGGLGCARAFDVPEHDHRTERGRQRLAVEQIHDHHDDVAVGSLPLLVVDAWGHAYYLQYQDRRADYMENVWKIL